MSDDSLRKLVRIQDCIQLSMPDLAYALHTARLMLDTDDRLEEVVTDIQTAYDRMDYALEGVKVLISETR